MIKKKCVNFKKQNRKKIVEITIHFLYGLLFLIISNIFPTTFKKAINPAITYEKLFYYFLCGIILTLIYWILNKNTEKLVKYICFTLYWSFSLSILKLNFILAFFLIYYIIALDWIEIRKIREDKTKEIYGSRRNHFNYMVKLLQYKKLCKKKLILIDGEWGTGKSYFVNQLFNVTSMESNYRIDIDVLVFNDKNHLIEYTLSEMKKILVDEGIRTNSISQLKKALKFIGQSNRKNFTGIFDDESLSKIEKDLCNDISKLNKPVYLVVENLERALDKETIIYVLGFIHKMYELVKTNFRILVLADSSKIRNLESFDENYIDKFFTDTILLSNISKQEIVLSTDISEIQNNTIEKRHILKAIDILSEFKKYVLEPMKLDGNYRNYCIGRIIELEEKNDNSRNILKLLTDSSRDLNQYNVIHNKTKNYNQSILIEQIIYTNMYKLYSPKVDLLNVSKLSIYINFIKQKENRSLNISKENFEEEFRSDYFSFFLYYNRLFDNDDYKYISEIFYRLLSEEHFACSQRVKKLFTEIARDIPIPDSYGREQLLLDFVDYLNESNFDDTYPLYKKL